MSAAQIKKITSEEPRLMAKIDKFELLPKIFKDNNLFLLPITRSDYVIVKGNGYQNINETEVKPQIHLTSRPFPESALGTESESIFLDYANSCGLLEKVCNASNLVLSFRGRRTTPSFEFRLDNIRAPIKVSHAQIEIDSVYEDDDQIIIFEAKINIPDSFSIRQLYYPYRSLFGKKRIRTFLFCLLPKTKEYLFWEFSFRSFENFNSITLLSSKKYKIQLSNPLSIKKYQDIQAKNTLNIPQADDINKIIQFPLRVSQGFDTAEKMINVFGFVKRQSSYYRQASEILGLVSVNKNRYSVTRRGEEFLTLSPEKRSNFICKLLLEFPIINEIFLQISIDQNKTVTKQDIIELLERKSHITGSTLSRRTQTIVSWFKWIRNNIGLVEVDSLGNISIANQLRF